MTVDEELGQREVVTAVSVRNLVRRQLELEADPWELALVQRDLVWREDGMAFLLDSLLSRYPIGSLLLCQVRGAATDARPQGTLQGAEHKVKAMTPQLVDGQQRSYALFSLFTDQGHGRFYIDFKADWTREARHIEWRHGAGPTDDEDGTIQPNESTPPDPHRFIDMGVFGGQASALADALGPGPLAEDQLDDALAAINPAFEVPRDEAGRTDALDKVNRILSAWHEPRIPVVTAVVEAPEDILELFTRVNRGGAVVSQNDLYFAAVKTFWHDPQVVDDQIVSSKAALDRVVTASGNYLNVWGALSLVSRLALAGLGEGDIVPLRVERLSRANKNYIIRAIRSVAPVAAKRIAPFVDVLRANSQLKQGLRFTHPHLWEEVLAWVVVSDRDASAWAPSDTTAVESYLLGATLFGYASKLREPYRRDALRVCLEAGAAAHPFPVEALLGVARYGSENLRRGRAEVLGSTDTQALARGHAPFVVAAAQGLEDESASGLDWDHIVPDSWRSKLRLPRGHGRRFRKEVAHINEPGNFWQIDFSANREVQAAAPDIKFAKLESWDPAGKGRVSPSRNSGLTLEHREWFESVGRELGAAQDEDARNEAAARLADLIKSRNEWLVQRLFELPIGRTARLFGADHRVDPVSPPSFPHSLPERLGLESLRAEYETSKASARKTKPATSASADATLSMGGAWTGLADRLESVLREVTKKHAKISGDGVGRRVWKDSDAQTLKRSFPLRPLVAGDGLVLIATGQRTADGHPPFWARFSHDSPNAEAMWELLAADSDLRISTFGGTPAVPIQVTPDMTWEATRQMVDDTLVRIRSTVEMEIDGLDASA